MKLFISQSILLQVYGMINIFCFLATLISQFLFQISFGIFTLLAYVIPVVSLVVLLMYQNQRGRKGLYLLGSLASCLSLLLISQNIFRATVRYRFGFWSGFYFILTTIVIMGIIYLTLFDETLLIIRKLSLWRYVVLWIGIILISILFYNWILVRFFPNNNWIFLSYSLWVINITLTMVTCFNLKVLVFKDN